MTELRIRSEALPDTAFVMPFLPAAVFPGNAIERDDDADFGPFLAAASRALGLMFGVPVGALPGRPVVSDDGAVPPVAPVLAALLATAQLGGDLGKVSQPGAPTPEAGSGVAVTRQALAIGEMLANVATRLWPAASTRAFIDLDIAVGAVGGHVRVEAPDLPRSVETAPATVLATRLFELPLRVRVELSSDMMAVSCLLPLRAGTVLPISPAPEMPLLVGDRRVGRVVVAPLPDGRQAATIVALRVETLAGGQA